MAAPGYPWATTVGPSSTAPLPILSSRRPLQIILLGLGTVGLGVYRELLRRPDLFEIRRIAVQHPAKHIAAGIDPMLLTRDVFAAIAEPADMVIELLGGHQPAASAIEGALAAGRIVVTANKELIASTVEHFEAVASRSGGGLRYSASVGGAVPMIEAVARVQLGTHEHNAVTSLRGVVNGTCNFILGELENGASLEDAVALAQAKGFAEQDPASDLSGADAAAKLRILARCVLGEEAPRVTFSGVDELTPNRARVARRAGRRLKLLAEFRRTSLKPVLTVSLAEITTDDWLADCNAECNALEIEMADGSLHRLFGLGAGRFPTTASVIADVYDAWRGFIGSPAASWR
ncbi:MAG: homoserine dehydrogenase [Proteobacteria bacterium]|nr:homoserine dehydrogenase [Pseudomonadota bacterium]